MPKQKWVIFNADGIDKDIIISAIKSYFYNEWLKYHKEYELDDNYEIAFECYKDEYLENNYPITRCEVWFPIKEIIIDSNITIAELSILFLENKYKRISFDSYGTYQDRLEIINEYLGNIKLKDFRKERINDFENYFNNERKWNYTFKPSNKTINEVMNVLNQLLKDATRRNLLDKYYNCIVKEKVSENERVNLTELQDQINNIQKKMITNSIDKIWKKRAILKR